MAVCKICEKEKPNREMKTWGGTVSETCLKCDAEKKAARKLAKAGDASKPAKPASAAAPDESDLALTVEAGSGFRAAIDTDADRLVVHQDNPARPEVPDNVTLSKTEAYVFFLKFAEWAGVKLAANN